MQYSGRCNIWRGKGKEKWWRIVSTGHHSDFTVVLKCYYSLCLSLLLYGYT